MLKNDEGKKTVSKKKNNSLFKHWQIVVILLIIYDVIAVHTAYFLALWGRFDFVFSQIPEQYLTPFKLTITLYSLLCIAILWIFRLYRVIWRFASYTELFRALEASFLLSFLYSIGITVFVARMPLTYYFFGALIQVILLTGARFSYRFYLLLAAKYQPANEATGRVMLIGAGSAGQMILRDINSTKEANEKVLCIIDDNPNKWGRYIDGVQVVGGRDDILMNVEKFNINKIYLAIPSATAQNKRDILSICSETDCKLKQLPGMYQFVLGQVSVSALKNISIEDLLGREQIKTDLNEVYQFLHGKTVLVTGGGGSIGSELCRQIAGHSPKMLIIFDVYENNAYDIQLELKERYPDLDMRVLIGSVRDSRRIFEVFKKYRPEIVYHAAAHKHVPLMEESPCEAVKNNTIGTYKTAYAAMVNGCERFVLISTDKAVNPTNIMGASKRLCEMIVQSFDAKIKAGEADEISELFTHLGTETVDKNGTGEVFKNIKTEFVAVRFGNVLGSNGSVIPIFKKQIENGLPVTVTHPDIIRYFMTIPEAVSLVMLAGVYAHGGEIFVLDMGSPVKIDTLARNLIKQAGYKPDVDIKIEYTGLRPGEKLFEEKLMAEEGLKKTQNDLIFIGSPIPFDANRFLSGLDKLMNASYSNKENIREMVEEMVTTYHPIDYSPAKKTERTSTPKTEKV
ncbi:MAG: polysaccharide biosynthesis protein [Clostridia bacterium]|nr:polysaccharide biosynthesis protein [Clostridia bacterium]